MRRLGAIGMGMLGIVTAACASSAGDGEEVGAADQNATAKVTGVTKRDRAAYLASARIWEAEDFANLDQKDLLTGPGGSGAFPATRNPDGSATFPAITCRFVEPKREKELGGATPKFQCGECKDGCNVDKTLKIKFGVDANANGEVYAEVMTSRLLWALGYKVDDVYPVRVTCKNCPADPWAVYKDFTPGAGERADRVYTAALVERKYDGPKIEESAWPDDKDGQGFGFDEVEKRRAEMPDAAGRAPNAEWSAFKLLAAFIKHTDNKASNQRLVCRPDAVSADGKCSAPFLMIQDGGATFGGGGGLFGATVSSSKAIFDEWNDSKVWFRRNDCQASLFSFHYSQPFVTNEGREFLLRLLDKITDRHLRDIFVASRIVERQETIKAGGVRRAVTVDDWIAAFHTKRDELRAACGR